MQKVERAAKITLAVVMVGILLVLMYGAESLSVEAFGRIAGSVVFGIWTLATFTGGWFIVMGNRS